MGILCQYYFKIIILLIVKFSNCLLLDKMHITFLIITLNENNYNCVYRSCKYHFSLM